jgi:hypothetical protein
LAGYILTAATTISAAGFLNAIILGLLGGFFGLLGKEAYYFTRDEYKAKSPIAKAWIAKKIEWVKSKINAR